MNDENLIPNSKRSPSEVRENGKKGGIASGKARRAKKTLKATTEFILSKANKPGDLTDFDTIQDAGKATLSAVEMLVLKLLDRALKGDPKAAELILRLKGGDFDNLDAERIAKAAKLKAEAAALKACGKNAKESGIAFTFSRGGQT